MLLGYCVLALFSETARTERNIMAVMLLVLAVFTVVSYGNIFVQGKYLCGMIVTVLIASILLNVSYSILMKKIICQNSLSREKHWINWRQGQILQS